MSLKNTIALNLKNIVGKKTRRKLVAIYADDFGSTRVKDKKAYDKLLQSGVAVDKTRYGYDTLCTTQDLQMLFDILTSVKDSQGQYACITPFANIANPDFDKIRQSGFSQYFREPFKTTLNKYGPAYSGAFDLWEQGITEGFFMPEYHGTEHINVRKFMNALQDRHRSTMLAFDNECVCTPSLPDDTSIKNNTAVFDIDKASDNMFLKEDIVIGLNMFEQLLGYRSTQFTPGAGIYSPLLHKDLAENGIRTIHVNRWKAYPLGDGKYVKRFLYNGKKNEAGQSYIVRNCPFETFFDNRSQNHNAVATCLKNIEAAFRWHAPALISTHRVNFTGAIEPTHRNETLKQFSILLHEIVRRWPEVEFVSGRKLDEIY